MSRHRCSLPPGAGLDAIDEDAVLGSGALTDNTSDSNVFDEDTPSRPPKIGTNVPGTIGDHRPARPPTPEPYHARNSEVNSPLLHKARRHPTLQRTTSHTYYRDIYKAGEKSALLKNAPTAPRWMRAQLIHIQSKRKQGKHSTSVSNNETPHTDRDELIADVEKLKGRKKIFPGFIGSKTSFPKDLGGAIHSTFRNRSPSSDKMVAGMGHDNDPRHRTTGHHQNNNATAASGANPLQGSHQAQANMNSASQANPNVFANHQQGNHQQGIRQPGIHQQGSHQQGNNQQGFVPLPSQHFTVLNSGLIPPDMNQPGMHPQQYFPMLNNAGAPPLQTPVPPFVVVRPIDGLHKALADFHAQLDMLLAGLRHQPEFPDAAVNQWKEEELNRLVLEIVPALGGAITRTGAILRDGMYENRGGVCVFTGGL